MSTLNVVLIVIAAAILTGFGFGVTKYMQPLTEGKVVRYRIRESEIVNVTEETEANSLRSVPMIMPGSNRMLVKGSWFRQRWVEAPADYWTRYPIGSRWSSQPAVQRRK